MGLKPFELLCALQIQGGLEDFTVEQLTPVNLSGEYAVNLSTAGELSFFGGGLPANWNPDQFGLLKFGEVSFNSTDNQDHLLFSAYADDDNNISLFKGVDNYITCNYEYNSKTFTVSAPYVFSSGTTVYIGMYLPALGERLTIFVDNNGDGTLESYASTERIGVFYPNVADGLMNLVSEDTGYRFNASGGIANITSGVGYAALITRDGLFSLVQES